MQVGDYVRTKYRITRITNLNTYCNLVIETDFGDVNKDKIIKSSPNIIDLIQEGDYVNGTRVIEVDDCKGAMREIYLEGQNPEKDCGFYFEDIKSIVTKEMFEEMEYKI